MSGNATTTATPQKYLGNSKPENRVRPGGLLGKKQYWYQTELSTGNVWVHRYMPGGQIVGPISTRIGTIRPSGTFEVASLSDGTPIANTEEILHYSEKNNVNSARLQATKVARRLWDGKTQPNPNRAINGPWTPPVDEPVKNPVQNQKENDLQGAENSQSKSETESKPADPNWQLPRKTKNTSLGAGESIYYPLGMRQQGAYKQDYLKLQMLQYSPKKMGFGGLGKDGTFDTAGISNLSGFGERPKNRTLLGSAILPIPGGIADNNNVGWSGETMNPVEAAIASVALGTIMAGLGEGGKRIKDIATAAMGNKNEVGTLTGTAIAAAASQTGSQLLKRTQGAILNPNMELLFSGPSLRQFNFSWKFAPRDPKEAQMVIKIIRFFKQGMAAIREEPNLFLRTPNTFQLSYHHKGSPHNYLNKFKECALVNCGVQYTPDGNYATYEDGVMTAYQMTLSFQELEPVYADDYDKNPTGPIIKNPVFSTGPNIGY